MINTLTLNPAVDREYLVSEIQFDTVLRSQEVRVDFGGKGFNVSRMLKSLGVDSTAVGFCGGRSGELLRSGLESLGIQTDFLTVSGETRTNVSVVSESTGKYIKVNEPGPQISHEALQELSRRVQSRHAPGDWWVLAGSLPPGVPPEIFAELTKDIQAGGGKVVLDTSGEPLHLGCQASPLLVKPNQIEAQSMTGLPVQTRAELLAAARRIREAGPEIMVISLGKEGALLVDEDGSWFASSPKIVEQNPIGAGDSMVAGLVYALSQGFDRNEALCWGVACGAATAGQPGTAVGSREMVETLLPEVVIQLIA